MSEWLFLLKVVAFTFIFVLMYLVISIVITVVFIIITIAYIASRINLRANCDHYWEDRGNGDIKCAKCNKKFKSA